MVGKKPKIQKYSITSIKLFCCLTENPFFSIFINASLENGCIIFLGFFSGSRIVGGGFRKKGNVAKTPIFSKFLARAHIREYIIVIHANISQL